MNRQEGLLAHIKDIRATNNDLWMEILAIALRSAPEETKNALAAIRENDIDVSILTGRIVSED